MTKASTAREDSSQQQELLRLLLIDDEAETWAGVLDQGLRPLGFQLAIESSAESAISAIRKHRPHVILLDLHFPNDDQRPDGHTTGGELLSLIRREFESVPVVIFSTRLADADIALEAFESRPHGLFDKSQITAAKKNGASWPQILAGALNNAIEIAEAESRPNLYDMGFVVGKTEAMRQVCARVRNAATHTLRILVFGETGTGKQGVAEAIHRLSGRTGRFEHLNCSGLNEETLSTLFFGRPRGAHTGRSDERAGLFELADGGTLFLDEIQSMPRPLQNLLVTVLDSAVICHTGSNQETAVDVRMIVATNQPFSELVADELLREDLAYRLNQFSISLPPLRDRREDLEELCQHFIGKANLSLGKYVTETIRPEVMHKLQAYPWPGNIRELESVIEGAVAITRSNVLFQEDIEILPIPPLKATSEVKSNAESGPTDAAEVSKDLAQSLAEQAANYVARIETLPIENRYAFVLNNVGDDLRKPVLIEIVRLLRGRQVKKVQHKQLANFLDPITNPLQDYERVRQMVIAAGVQLTKLDFNQ